MSASGPRPDCRPRVLVVDDEPDIGALFQAALGRAGYEVRPVGDGPQALALLREAPVDLVFADIRMEPITGLELLRRIRQDHPGIPVVMITGYGSIPGAVEAVRCGAVNYLTKPFVEIEEIVLAARAALQGRGASSAAFACCPAPGAGLGGMVGASAPMQRLFDQIARAAASNAIVLLEGESGTGKELTARAIHERSRRARGPFVPINCCAIPENLLESELFGYVKGAFSGAVAPAKGMLVAADGGTAFLDEIAELSPTLQAKLLRVLEDGEVKPLGSPRSRRVDVRVIAATNADLRRAIDRGRFRQDLYFRLHVITLRLPPLRERRGDIPLLVQHFVRRLGERGGRGVRAVTPQAMARLVDHDWPGNVRELENSLASAYALGAGTMIDLGDLPVEIRGDPGRCGETARPSGPLSLHEGERELLRRALAETGGNIRQAARLLGVDRKTVYRKLARYDLR